MHHKVTPNITPNITGVNEVINSLKETYEPVGVLYIIKRFFLKEFKIWTGYGSLVLLDFIQIFLPILTYFFLDSLISNKNVGGFSGGYFSFVIVGISFQHFVYEIFMAIDWNTRREQNWGTVEAVLVTPINPITYALGNYSCYFCYSWFYVILTLGTGMLLLGFRPVLNLTTVLSTIVVSCLLVTSHLGFGLASMGAILVTKAANPAATVFDWISRLLCGMFYPIAILPIGLRIIAFMLPLTYSLDALRHILLNGESLWSIPVLKDVATLLVISVLFIPLGILVLNMGYRKALRDGTLGHY
ncbi:hypothetical protein BBF96_10280 [Anoxybacter fermentans]|uniref:Transport permease protein n=1 Tax=Anoxybacter fermentans TaxID=1323375 RepID=A0A3Q9HR17_9FIRM|nr:ABC transporter permease [Anoxybacter fermentans]AZR73737.1 hypothetical protein BBF96_10280 [Anoxybacter fermentans]